ncbi:DEAD/DEAH box helicase [Arthrobacter sp. Soc17.1.1.1]|uniref:DEAD/DEAH box helicase n=1 Tax=Arthrobacter sp. Soc17.1.1.1 TaxID=3121277 RepID=UPI002FE45291
MMTLDIVETFSHLRGSYFRYYDTPFGLADKSLEQERRRILDRDNGVYREPFIELRPEYKVSALSLEESAATASASADLADFARMGLIPDGRDLYTHQESALVSAVRDRRNVVVTAGTGAGKTEAFLLPLLSNLLSESASWAGRGASPASWWDRGSTPFTPQRATETGRVKAVRSIILYPMNALVDDQLIRLRRTLDSDAARSWLDANRRGHRFYFGRYTGATPVTGEPGDSTALRNLRSYMRDIDHRSAQLEKLEGDSRYFMARPRGAEMVSRWDMADAAPDILITNYSMLNVLLLRGRDSRYFDSTRRWLEASPANRFTFVVDELHSYRGTAGTEVALLIRNLKMRLGLAEDSGQFQVIAASASLEAGRDEGFVEGFFGVPRQSFDFLSGQLVRAQDSVLDLSGTGFADAEGVPSKEDMSAAASALGNVFFRGSDGTSQPKPEAKSLKALGDGLFPALPADARAGALQKLLKTAGSAREDSGDLRWPLLRAHLFFRNVPGMWACTDPACPQAPSGSSSGRPVGRLYSEPVSRCLCGSRVLEFLYCQNCGDVFLGGYAPAGSTQRPGAQVTLLADLSDIDRLPDRAGLERTASNYLLYWPRQQRPDLDELEWTADGRKVEYAFRRSVLMPGTGELRPTADDDHTGWTFHVSSPTARQGPAAGVPKRDPEQLSPFPTRCPNCADDWEITHTADGPVRGDDKKRQRSPIRAMRTGFEKINQVLITELLQDLDPANRKTIVFTDSRQDAAKLSSGIGLRHYQDLLRLLLHAELAIADRTTADISLARERIVGGERTQENLEAVKRLKDKDLGAYSTLRAVWEDESELPEAEAIRRMSEPPALPALTGRVGKRLTQMGLNPGGPAASLQHTREDPPSAWSRMYRWEPSPERRQDLSLAQERLQDAIDLTLQKEVIDGLFSGAGRDYESLGLGWIGPLEPGAAVQHSPSSPDAIAQSSLRILAGMRRFAGMRNESETPPRKLKNFWKAAATGLGLDMDDIQAGVLRAWGGTVSKFLIHPDGVTIHPPADTEWICRNCHRRHLVYACGLCTYCGKDLPEGTARESELVDYYGYKAVHAQGEFRLTAAELTGQTDRLDAQSRQARFQNVFLDQAENRKTDGIELLSVTTTMEAGVDIGALDSVVLANMPPTRFNYQQRVGRAGRRLTPMAVSLTVCRGRTHDEYYFGRPELITNEPTPKPYLALDRPEIVIRALRSEVLRRAFADLTATLTEEEGFSGPGSNTHGQFGLVSDWPAAAPRLAGWLHDRQDLISDVIRGLTEYTDLPPEDLARARQSIGSLAEDISRITSGHTAGHPDLSQRLAENGLLPMFGFPSKVRDLYLQRPRSPFPWPPDNTINRDAAMAVSQFAPGSELVRDGRIYPVIGVASFRPAGFTVRPEDNPLGEERLIDICRQCAFVEEKPAGADHADQSCPRCGADPGTFGTIDLREPEGYRAGDSRDFDGNFSWSPTSTSTRAVADLQALLQVPLSDSVAYSGRGRRYVINDNAGKSFQFQQAPPAGQWGGYLALTPGTSGSQQSAPIIMAALGTIQPTDFLFYGPRSAVSEAQGLRLDLRGGRTQPYGVYDSIQGRRAAWYSLSFLMRTVAAKNLDIQPQEFSAGIHTGMQQGEPTTFAFLADTLENGAGFSSHLGSPGVLPGYLADIDAYLADLGGTHSTECSSSCYRCLRDYSNMAYHALLDWRLARDLRAVLDGQALAIDISHHQQAISSWAKVYNVTGIHNHFAACGLWENPADGRVAVILRHPLESAETGLMSARLTKATEQIRADHKNLDGVVYLDAFMLDRNPGHAVGLIRSIRTDD